MLLRRSHARILCTVMRLVPKTAVTAPMRHILRRIVPACVLMAILLTFAFALDVSYGETEETHVPFRTLLRIVVSHLPFVATLPSQGFDQVDHNIIWAIRFPRALLAACVGVLLAMSGVALQGLLHNPLADPYTVGVSSGAALGAGVALLFNLGELAAGFGVPATAFAFAMGAMCVVYWLARSASGVSIHSFLLAGIVVGSFLWAFLSLVLAVAAGDPQQAQDKIVSWLLGNFGAADPWSYVHLSLPFVATGLIVLLGFSRDLNVFSLGEESAKHLGLETENLKLVILMTASMMTAAAVSVSGIIGFVGLVVPHICRRLFGPDHRVLVPTSALTGATLTVLADLASRAILPPSGLPVGIVTAILGAPFFLYLLRTSKRG